MQVYAIHTLSDLQNVPSGKRAVALGLFDGVHIGHHAVLSRAMDCGQDVTSCVFTFADGTAMPKKSRSLLTAENKELLLARSGAEEMLSVDFDCVRQLSPQEFVTAILRDTLHAVRVCCGENFRFGRDGAGDAALLSRLCEAEHIDVQIVGTVECDGEPVSSSRIRKAIADGDLPLATRLLGHPFRLDAVVSEGQRFGRTIGFPTLNQILPDDFVLPRFGVYLSAVEIDGVVHTALTNIGCHPTVGATRPQAETWIPDYDGDLYGQSVRTIPVAFLRPEQTFDSPEALRAQLQRDAQAVRERVTPTGRIRAVVFDFDDTLQDRPSAYWRYVRRFTERHFPDLPPAEREARAEEMWHKNGDGHACLPGQRYIPYESYFEGLVESWKWADAPSVPDLIAECRTMLATETSLFPDAVDVIKRLREKGYLVGVVTNGFSAMQSRKLDMAGIRPLLDVTVISGDEGVRKPNPEIFARAAARLGIAPQDCLYIGDHPYYDMQGAAESGWRRALIDVSGRNVPPEGVPVLRRLSDLWNIL